MTTAEGRSRGRPRFAMIMARSDRSSSRPTLPDRYRSGRHEAARSRACGTGRALVTQHRRPRTPTPPLLRSRMSASHRSGSDAVPCAGDNRSRSRFHRPRLPDDRERHRAGDQGFPRHLVSPRVLGHHSVLATPSKSPTPERSREQAPVRLIGSPCAIEPILLWMSSGDS